MNLKVEDYYPSGKRFLLRFKEKGGKEKDLPVHHKLEELLSQYLKETGLEKEPESPLFPAAIGKTGKLSRQPLHTTLQHAQRQLKNTTARHLACTSFPATGWPTPGKWLALFKPEHARARRPADSAARRRPAEVAASLFSCLTARTFMRSWNDA